MPGTNDPRSQSLPAHALIEQAEKGVALYLHKELHLDEKGGASLLKPNAKLGKALLQRIARSIGMDTMVCFGYQPIAIQAQEDTATFGVGIVRQFATLARTQSRRPVSESFANRATLMLAAKKAESILSTPPMGDVEAFLYQHAGVLGNRRDRAIPGTCLTRALADTLCTLYLREVAEQSHSAARTQPKQEEELTALVLAAMLKNYSRAVQHTVPAAPALDPVAVAARASVHLLRGGSPSLTADDLALERESFRREPDVLASAYKIILESANPMTKSVTCQVLLRGVYFSAWLLSRRNDQGLIRRETLQKACYFLPLETPHFLDLGLLAADSRARPFLEAGLPQRCDLRLAMLHKSLASRNIDVMSLDGKQLSEHFHNVFGELPDYNPIGFEPLRRYALYDLALRQHEIIDAKREELLTAFLKRLRNLLF